jgi:hypothetical protein
MKNQSLWIVVVVAVIIFWCLGSTKDFAYYQDAIIKIENLQSRQKYLSDQKKASEAKGIKGFFEKLMTPGSITPWTKEKENVLKQINTNLSHLNK